METEIIVAYCVCDDIIKSLGIKEDVQVRMSMAEILTTAITAGMFFYGNQEQTRKFLKEYGYMPNMLSKSQFNRRLHSIPHNVLEVVFSVLSNTFKTKNMSNEYVVDSFPVAVCKNIRISRNKIYKKEEYRGKCASKHEYFYGIKVHMISTVEMLFSPGS